MTTQLCKKESDIKTLQRRLEGAKSEAEQAKVASKASKAAQDQVGEGSQGKGQTIGTRLAKPLLAGLCMLGAPAALIQSQDRGGSEPSWTTNFSRPRPTQRWPKIRRRLVR